jgi:prefoldin subunit 5
MLDPFDQLNRHTEELLAQKQMLLVLAENHNRLNAKLEAIKTQHSQILTALENLTTTIIKSDKTFKVMPDDPQ